MKRYTVITPIRAGERYAPGEPIDLSEKDAAPLLACKAIAPAPAAAAPKKERPNAAETVKLVEAAATLADLEALTEGEDRKSVIAAIEKRGQELAQPKDVDKD